MAKMGVQVSRAELLKLLGLPEDSVLTDDELVEEAHNRAKKLADIEKIEAAARAEDHQLVAAAVRDGRLPSTRASFWKSALATDRDRNRAALASLAPGLRPDGTVGASAGTPPRDHAVEAVHREVLRKLGIRVPERVEAAAEPTAYERGVAEHTRRVRQEQAHARTTDDLGLPIPNFPAPVVITRGKPQSEWSERERADALQRKLGPRFYAGTKPAPGASMTYMPSPNDPYEFDPETGQWREKPRQTRTVE